MIKRYALALILAGMAIAQAAPSLAVVKTTGTITAGGTVGITVVLAGSAGLNQADVEWDFTVPAGVTISAPAAGPAATAASKTLTCNAANTRCIVSGVNNNSLADGILATFSVKLPAPLVVGPLIGITTPDANLVSANVAGVLVATTVSGSPLAFAPCDIDGSGLVDTGDVSLILAQALGQTACSNSITGNGCTAVDVRRVEIAAQGGACVTGP